MAETKWVLDGRFIQQDTKGEFMGQPWVGFGLTGYDNMSKMFVSFWVDNSSTAMYSSRGTYDAGSKTFTFYGTMDDPMTSQHGKTVKYVLKIESSDRHVFEFHDLGMPEGKTKTGEIVSTRRQVMKDGMKKKQ